MLFRVLICLVAVLRTGEDAPATSLIDLVLGVQAEPRGPAYCATIGIRP